jgi:hypothetical protein
MSIRRARTARIRGFVLLGYPSVRIIEVTDEYATAEVGP